MPRSRSNSRPPSRPASRPASMISTALNLSPQVLSLSDELIAKVTGFAEDEENFELCHDFVVSNLLYHTYLEPHEKDATKRFEGILDKWQIQSKTEKAQKGRELLESYMNAPIFDEVEHEQHNLKTRLLTLLLCLSNSDAVTAAGEDNEEEDEGIGIYVTKDGKVKETEEEARLRKARAVLAMLAEGEVVYHPPSADSDLSDWTDDEFDPEDEWKRSIFDGAFEKAFAEQTSINKPITFVIPRPKKPVTHLPGVREPLRPPVPICDDDRVGKLPEDSKEDQEKNLMPPYWLDTNMDGRNKFAVSVTNPMPDAHYVRWVENWQNHSGLPVDEKLVLPEYQVLRECFWMLRNPLCDKTPLFVFDKDNNEFRSNRESNACLPSVMPATLESCLFKMRLALTSLRRLQGFVSECLDSRRRSPIKNEEVPKPPFTYEAYAEAMSNVINLFSADLLMLEAKAFDAKVAYTLLDMTADLNEWLVILNSLSSFHKSTIGDGQSKDNWEKAVILLAGLNHALTMTLQPKLFAILADLLLKTLSPYFRIMGTWITQGRLEDFRDEFVFSANVCSLTKRRSSEDKDDDEEEEVQHFSRSSKVIMPDESFWMDGFNRRPFEAVLEAAGLRVPEMFESTLSRILTCGKSVTILTILEKQSIFFPGYKSTTFSSPTNDMIPPTELYDRFLDNLKESLSAHLLPDSPTDFREGRSTTSIKHVQAGLSIGEILGGDVSAFDSELVDAFDIIATDLPVENEQENKHDPDEDGNPEVLIDRERFFVLSQYGLDPLKPLTSTLDFAFGPVVHEHTERACNQLVQLFKTTLQLEKHLTNVRRVFLMEAGDLMSEFYSVMFDKLASTVETCDGTSLTILLQDCLCRRYSFEDAERFGLTIDPEAKTPLDTISLTYTVQWPLNIVVHSSTLVMYNKVFVFLLKVKQAIWALQEIEAKELAEAIEPEEDPDEVSESFGDETTTSSMSSFKQESKADKEHKLHRVLLLRSWLLHFIGNCHAYFMTRVLHTTELELRSALAECSDLDAILIAHNEYIERIFDRCFLHSSAAVLREAVLKVLNIANVLHKHCSAHLRPSSTKTPRRRHFIVDSRTLTALEENYARCHQFLASTLRSMTQKRNVPHLDCLAAALLHSYPVI